MLLSFCIACTEVAWTPSAAVRFARAPRARVRGAASFYAVRSCFPVPVHSYIPRYDFYDRDNSIVMERVRRENGGQASMDTLAKATGGLQVRWENFYDTL
ncbi:hypothetical protein VTO73DRAFT_13280 [Trametes versicolor]